MHDRSRHPLLPWLGAGAVLLVLLLLAALTGRRAEPIFDPFEATATAATELPGPYEKMIVLGIDGVDYQLLKAWMEEGELPNFSRLEARGDFKALGTSNPPQSPVAWCNFITGMDSGTHAIFDFVHRDPDTYLPFSALSEVKPADEHVRVLGLTLPNQVRLPFSDYIVPLSGGTTENLRRGTPFWQTLTEHGVPAVIHRVPVNFPPTGAGATTLSGMGTPDVQGTNGTYSYYTDNPPDDWGTASGGRIYLVEALDGVVHAKLYGPPNDFIDYARIEKRTGQTIPYQEHKATLPFDVYVDAAHHVARVDIDGQEIFLEEGTFSPWIEVNFSLLPTPGLIHWAWSDLVRVAGTVQFYLKSTSPDFALYVTPVQISPLHPALPISTPPEYAAELAAAVGPFFTQGMPEDTKALEKDVFGNAEFMKQVEIILGEETRMARYELDRLERGFLFLYFTVIDQSGHAMWRTMRGQEDHPAYDRELDDAFKDVYPELYRRLDEVVGMTLDYVDDRTLMVVMSDHGFSSWKRAFDLNRWLYDHGYLVLQPGVEPEDLEYFQGVDWSRTRLYGVGINGLYVNQLGRERYGIVPPGPQKRRLLEEVAAQLEAIRDPTTGEPPILKAYLTEDIYSGPNLDRGPDAQIGYNRGYRVTDGSATGEIGPAMLSDNTRRWSGDHCQDPRQLPGVILANCPIRKSDPTLLDLAPTILSAFGITPPEELRGRSVL